MVTKNITEMDITEGEFSNLINNGHKLVVIDFYADWCMPCIMLDPIIDDLSEQIKEVKFVKMDLDDNKEIAKKYDISNIPCLLIFKNGELVEKITGNHNIEIIEEKLRSHLD